MLRKFAIKRIVVLEKLNNKAIKKWNDQTKKLKISSGCKNLILIQPQEKQKPATFGSYEL